MFLDICAKSTNKNLDIRHFTIKNRNFKQNEQQEAG